MTAIFRRTAFEPVGGWDRSERRATRTGTCGWAWPSAAAGSSTRRARATAGACTAGRSTSYPRARHASATRPARAPRAVRRPSRAPPRLRPLPARKRSTRVVYGGRAPVPFERRSSRGSTGSGSGRDRAQRAEEHATRRRGAGSHSTALSTGHIGPIDADLERPTGIGSTARPRPSPRPPPATPPNAPTRSSQAERGVPPQTRARRAGAPRQRGQRGAVRPLGRDQDQVQRDVQGDRRDQLPPVWPAAGRAPPAPRS